MFPNFDLSSVDETPDWGPLELRFFDYLTSMNYGRAIQLLGLCSSPSDVSKLAKNILGYVPERYFTHELPIFSGKHFEMINDRLTVVEAEGDGLEVAYRKTPPVRFVAHWKRGRAKPATRKRRLNAFMAFRAFIDPAFPGVLQKDKSVIIARMWKNDLHRTDWFIIAEAYTTIRDNFDMADLSLPQFVQEIACGMLRFPDSTNYTFLSGYRIKSVNPFLISCHPFQLRYSSFPFGVDECVDYYRAIGLVTRQLKNSTYVPLAVSTGSQALARFNAENPRPEDPLNWAFDDNDRLRFAPEEHTLTEIWGEDIRGLQDENLIIEDMSDLLRL